MQTGWQTWHLLLMWLHYWTKYQAASQRPFCTWNVQPGGGFHEKVEHTEGTHTIGWSPLLVPIHIRDTAWWQFETFKTVESEMHMISSHFTSIVANTFICRLTNHSSLKERNFPNLRKLLLFGSTYICEQTLPVMKFTKCRHKYSLDDVLPFAYPPHIFNLTSVNFFRPKQARFCSLILE